MTAFELATRLHAKPAGDGWLAKCPAHDDRKASLSIGVGGDGRTLLHCHAGCALDDILAAAHLEQTDLSPEQQTSKKTIVATYHYHDEGGRHLYNVVVRLTRRTSSNDAPTACGHSRVFGACSTGCPSYKGSWSPTWLKAKKTPTGCARLVCPVQRAPGGAGKWRSDYSKQLRAASVESVVVIPDNDDAGRDGADQVARSCHDAAGLRVKIVPCLGFRQKVILSDWLDTEHSKAELIALGWQRHVPPTIPTLAASGERAPLDELGDFLAEPDEQHHYITEGCLTAGISQPDVREAEGRKVHSRPALGAGIARGGSWLGRACKQGTVWYLAFEGRRADIRKHFQRMGATPAGAARLHRTGACRRCSRAQGARHPRTPAFHHHRHDAAAAQGEVHRRLRRECRTCR